MLSLLLFETSPPRKLFVLLQNQKASSEPMGGNGSPLAANKKAGNTMLFRLRTSPEAISAFCLCCASALHMSLSLPLSRPAPTLHKHAVQELIAIQHFLCHWLQRELVASQRQVVPCVAVCVATPISVPAVQWLVTTTPTHGGEGNGLAEPTESPITECSKAAL